MGDGDKTLGTILLEKGLLSEEGLAEALALQEDSGQRLGEILVERGRLGEDALRWALAEQMDLPLVHPDPQTLDPDALALVPPDLCRRYGVLPLHLTAEEPGSPATLTLAAADPALHGAIDDITRRVGRPVRVVAALREEIEAALRRLYGPAVEDRVDVRSAGFSEGSLEEILEDPTGAGLVRHLLHEVWRRHLGGFHARVRSGEARVEGLTGELLFEGGETWHTILLDRLRQMAGLGGRSLDVLQRGRFSSFPAEGEEHGLFRLSILKGVEGEEAQVTSLTPEQDVRSLAELGVRTHQILEIRKALEKPGLVWIAASSEQGIGSTLFGLLREIPGSGRAVTVEDEVFYRSPDLLQIETLNLGPGDRRRILRELKYLDCDRVMVDRASPAELGDLLALATRKRWVLAGTPESNLAEALTTIASRSGELPLYGLRMVIHQRLVPLLCPECKSECVLGTAEKQAIAGTVAADATLHQEGDGCSACGGRAVHGARAFFEILPVGTRIREALHAQGRGESRLDSLVGEVNPSVRGQVAEAVARGEVSLSEFWDLL